MGKLWRLTQGRAGLLVVNGGHKGADNKTVELKGEMHIKCTAVPPYSRVIRSKTYRGYVKQQVITNAIQYNVIFV
jgi:hypothetical protein